MLPFSLVWVQQKLVSIVFGLLLAAQSFDIFKKTMEVSQQPVCAHCQFVMRSEIPKDVLRCGHAYLSLPPAQRRPHRMDRYPIVAADACCELWRVRESSRVGDMRDLR